MAPFRPGPKVRGKPRERNSDRMRPYEMMYLLPPTADEERLNAVSERLQHTITTLGGKVDKVTPPTRRRLAYELAHHRDGHYGVLAFSLPPAQARELVGQIALT